MKPTYLPRSGRRPSLPIAHRDRCMGQTCNIALPDSYTVPDHATSEEGLLPKTLHSVQGEPSIKTGGGRSKALRGAAHLIRLDNKVVIFNGRGSSV